MRTEYRKSTFKLLRGRLSRWDLRSNIIFAKNRLRTTFHFKMAKIKQRFTKLAVKWTTKINFEKIRSNLMPVVVSVMFHFDFYSSLMTSSMMPVTRPMTRILFSDWGSNLAEFCFLCSSNFDGHVTVKILPILYKNFEKGDFRILETSLL